MHSHRLPSDAMSVAELPGQLIGERFEVLDPSTGQRIADVPRSKAVDVDRAVPAAREVLIDAHGAGTGIELPCGGFQQSGIGREQGVAGYLEYSQIKNICVKVDSA